MKASENFVILSSYNNDVKIRTCDLWHILVRYYDYISTWEFLDEYTFEDARYIEMYAEDEGFEIELLDNRI
ncbi:hypothetical protein SAMN05444416_10998 [Thermoactinomyces sp. DSM 45892]|nr:hypothetical protein SAMN05444416_10998 [Thermoactinomyces sp. DSM 45892]